MAVYPKSTPVADYLATIWNAVKTTAVGLGITGRYLLKKPVTLQYPDEKPAVPEGYRGIHVYEIDKCIACDLCAVACPVDCIYIESIGKGKTAQLTRYEIDYNRCMFCALCVEPCPTDCIHMGKSYDLTKYDSESCSVDFVKIWTDGKLQSPTGERIEWFGIPKDQPGQPAKPVVTKT
jgi:NADH-quinone oxidoreductase subunit I